MAFVDPKDPYVYSCWENALNKLGIEVHSDKSRTNQEIWIEDYDTQDFDHRNSQAKKVYSYIYRKAITRKNYLNNTIIHYRVKRPDSILHSCWPDTFCFELDYPEFLDDSLDECYELKQEIQDPSKTWILKPALGERAYGIRLFRTQDDLQKIFDEFGDEDTDEMRQYVVQEYVSDIKLIDEHKFHLRVYVLCVGKLKVYVNPHFLALFSGTKYDAQDLHNLKAHLTNTCYQQSEARVDLFENICKEGYPQVLNEICEAVKELFLAAESDTINFQSLPNAFEFYGLDFLVTQDYKVKLLEVNAYPDFKQTGSDLKSVVENMIMETADLVVNDKEPQDLVHVLTK